MTLVKIDHLRRIDQFIDYFGEPRQTASNGPRPYGIATVDSREPRRREAVSASVMTTHAFYAAV